MENEKIFTLEQQQEMLSICDNISLAIGSKEEEQIESALADLITLKEFVSSVTGLVIELQNDLENSNKRCLSLQQANNKAVRQLYNQQEQLNDTTKELSISQSLATIF